MRRPRSLTRIYIYLAVGCGTLGIVLTFLVISVCQYYGVDITENLWVLAIPVALPVLLNVSLIELYRKLKSK